MNWIGLKISQTAVARRRQRATNEISSNKFALKKCIKIYSKKIRVKNKRTKKKQTQI